MLAFVPWSCVPSFLSALLLCAWCVVFEYGLISRFKGVFSGVLGVSCGFVLLACFAWLVGLCTRVELGGFRACCVFAFLLSFCLCPFAFRFISLLLLLSFCPCVSVSALLCLFSCLVFPFLFCFVVSFSLSDYTQKERAQRVVPCVLACLVVGCFIWLLLCTLRTRPGSIR